MPAGASESRKDATELETMTSTAGKNVATNDQASLLEMEDEFEEFELEGTSEARVCFVV